MNDDNDSKVRVTKVFTFERRTKVDLPMFLSGVQAGFPSPADDYVERKLDLNEHLIEHPAATFFVRVSGDSMIDAGIHSGDILIVDRALDPADGKVVIAALDGELTVKRIAKRKEKLFLVAENPAFKPIEINDNSDLIVWGVVTYSIHKL
jgi:DNA polymerase V